MSNPLQLSNGRKYRVVRVFSDYDKIIHPVGEEWIFVKTNFSPYEDGLTLYVTQVGESKETVFRFKWTKDEQSDLIENFREFVAELLP